MRQLLEVYRWITVAAFLISGGILAIPIIVFFLPGNHVDLVPGTGLIGLILFAGTFAASGFNVIAIAIYDQVRAATNELEQTRAEIEYLRADARDRG